MRRRTRLSLLLGFVAMLAAAASSAEAQLTATAVLKSGQRHTGTNLAYRVDGREVIVRTSHAEEPRIPVGQVAYIDFGGTADPANMNLSGSQEAVVMRDGSVQKGQILELGHTNKADLSSPFLVVFRTENGEERRLPSNQVARVYFAGGQPSSGSTSTGSVGTAVVTPASGYTVSAQQAWSNTGIVLNRGEVFTVNATGEIATGGGDNPKSTPGGSGRTEPGNPLPGVATGTLIGRIGNGQPFVIGTQTRVTAPAAGQLFLGINDTNFGDNQGTYQVEIQRTGRRTRS
jgi:PA-IL-like protein